MSRRVSSGCTSGTRIGFTVIFSDGVILDETIPDQVRLHHVILLGKLILAAIARTKHELPTQTQVMLFRRGNKISHMAQERQIGA
jgi:hypothetical protein